MAYDKKSSPSNASSQGKGWLWVTWFVFMILVALLTLAIFHKFGGGAQSQNLEVETQTTFVPDCADQKDVFFENGETVKTIHIAPCKSGLVHTPPGTKWYTDTLPHDLAVTLCYQDGECKYYGPNDYPWEGVKRGVFRAIGDRSGDLVITVE